MAHKRIYYIDNIKGFAILLVVMGHVIANWYNDFNKILENDTNNDLMVWKLIYIFHMPLFMFCSGLFQPVMDEKSTMHDIWNIVIRRFKVLMIPYFFSGLLLWTVTGRPSFYWFLLVLFEFIVINLTISFVACRFGRYSNYVESVLFLVSFLAIHVITTHYSQYEKLPLLDIGHLNLYIFFTLGYLVIKYNILDCIFCNWGYTLSLLLFVFLYTIFYTVGIKLTAGGIVIHPLMPLAVIYAIFYFFKIKDTSVDEKEKMTVLNWLGRHSLEIYILHFFFLVRVPFVGDFIHESALIGGGRLLFVMGISISLLMAVINMCFCYGVWLVISKSNLLSQLLLGRKYKL